MTSVAPMNAGPAAEAVPQPSTDELMMLVQAARGAGASVLLALAFTGREMSHGELMLWTHCGHAQVTNALRSLIATGWVSARTLRGPWSLAQGHALPVTSALQESSALKALNNDDGSLREQEHHHHQVLNTSARREQTLAALRQAGIQDPTASTLADLPHVTPEYVRAHVQQALAQGLRLGAAIRRIELGSPLSETEPGNERARRSERQRQRDVEEKIRRFKEGV